VNKERNHEHYDDGQGKSGERVIITESPAVYAIGEADTSCHASDDGESQPNTFIERSQRQDRTVKETCGPFTDCTVMGDMD